MSRRNRLAPTPPMGWNSWNCYGTTVREDEVLANAEAMRRHLLPVGYDTVVVDIQWYEPNARAHGYRKDAELCLDAWGRMIPAANRFPSAADGKGFTPLADRIHAMGLRFGIHVMRGIPRQAVAQRLPILGADGATADQCALPDRLCSWCTDMVGVDVAKPAGRAWYASLARLFADWGVDYVKADDMGTPHWGDEIAALRSALDGCGRDIVLSISPGIGADTANADSYLDQCELWRISPDLWDSWDKPQPWYAGMAEQFDLLARWAPFSGPGHFADADMLPMGRLGLRAEHGEDRLSRLSLVEQRSMIALWSIARSPLMFGGDLPSLDPATLAILVNPVARAAHRDGRLQAELHRDGPLRVWRSRHHDGRGAFIGLFNLSDQPLAGTWPVAEGTPTGTWTEAWTGASLHRPQAIAYALRPHGSALYRIEP